MNETYSFKICLCHVYEDNIKSIKLLERNGFDKIHKSWFYQDVLYRNHYIEFILNILSLKKDIFKLMPFILNYPFNSF